MNRRRFLYNAASAVLAVAGRAPARTPAPRDSSGVTLFLCGDVMTGRGIDQVLPHPSDPRIYERSLKSALGYLRLAEAANGPIARPVDFEYIWGAAIEELDQVRPDAKIINLETSVTKSDDWVAKGINYRMHPANVPCLTAAGIECCALGNNHILDWGYSGLSETLATLRKAGLKTAGAGRDLEEAEAPAILELDGERRVLVFSFGSVTAGIPRQWAATKGTPGVNLLANLSGEIIRRVAKRVEALKRPGDIVVASIHWGGNWGYDIPGDQRTFAHSLVEEAYVDVVHGHSSHHAKGIEVYKEKPILYGCGDFINDYEGIHGHEEYRADLCLMYFVRMDPSTGTLSGLEMTPLQMRRFRLNHASKEDARWLRDTLDRESRKLDTRVESRANNTLSLEWH